VRVNYYIKVNVESSQVGTPEYQEGVDLRFVSNIPFFPQKGQAVAIGRENLTVFRSFWCDKTQTAWAFLSEMKEGVEEMWYRDLILEELQADGWVVLPPPE
jgi:hypothetical protein